MTQDLNTLLTALYVKIDDEIGGTWWMGRPPLLTDSELVYLAVAQALLGYRSEARWLRFARKHLAGMFPYLPQQSGCNKRLRSALPLVKRMIRAAGGPLKASPFGSPHASWRWPPRSGTTAQPTPPPPDP